MQSVADTAWLLLGVSLGLAICVVAGGRPAGLPVLDELPLASLTVFAMLVGSVRTPRTSSRVTA